MTTNLFGLNFTGQDVLVNLFDMDQTSHIEGRVIAADDTGFVLEEIQTTGPEKGQPIHCWYPTTSVRYVQLASGVLSQVRTAA